MAVQGSGGCGGGIPPSGARRGNEGTGGGRVKKEGGGKTPRKRGIMETGIEKREQVASDASWVRPHLYLEPSTFGCKYQF
ncbi:unnamed protein product [Pleuronectes platessa]|uniref:Uncharacterized protein n=1 Tax=Pleuronectes platessa TaxID=8262 RepID=A0A9N7UVF0_PLEPL|nr:unnamed protein product [Pleuronectes platessa]